MTTPRLGLRENWHQFSLLVLVNAFVGGMVGLERTILPRLAEQEFHLVARSAILSFIVVFGLTKAAANYYAGAWATTVGRKNLLVIGWLIGLPVPLLLLWAPSWGWVIVANVLLGLNQGLAWSSTVVMKIDLVGPKQRGLAMGLNESAGYLAVAATAFASGWLATEYGLRPYPFYLGIGLAMLGLLSSLLVRDTRHHVALEAAQAPAGPTGPPLSFWDVTWRHPNLGSVTQAGLVNNLNDGMVWGLLPLLLASKGFTLTQIGTVAAVYPAVWGLGQLVTGPLADRLCKKDLLFWGMLLQGAVLLVMLFTSSYPMFLLLAGLLGAGTALVYPTFLAAVAEYSPLAQRAHSVGIFRLWRDAGYAIGALLTGVLADMLGLSAALAVIGGLTVLSSLVIRHRMYCLPAPDSANSSAGSCAQSAQTFRLSSKLLARPLSPYPFRPYLSRA
ncbi:MFS transporter [Hymenobacter psychrotolerans]|uniref:Predicted arabinose efflux permease, MFS family n=1 Tax=Hymenobacter psychrotolerans DSM 18569 TaxID=1121959 RepID=A0A1M6ZW55_9BACT|nr:MFS transporter [Hymenobacter psychrotolerans]SHL34616.1 Predicted arabinose efflux permease, MFS family [Hymenobacter psychrotolerans DSM 18569]